MTTSRQQTFGGAAERCDLEEAKHLFLWTQGTRWPLGGATLLHDMQARDANRGLAQSLGHSFYSGFENRRRAAIQPKAAPKLPCVCTGDGVSPGSGDGRGAVHAPVQATETLALWQRE